MKKIQSLSLVLLLLAMLASCTSNSFKIDGNLANLEGSMVRIVFEGDSGLVDELVNADKKGHFTFKGSASQPTLVNVLSHRGKPITMVVAANGDHIKVKGDARKAMDVAIKGNSRTRTGNSSATSTRHFTPIPTQAAWMPPSRNT